MKLTDQLSDLITLALKDLFNLEAENVGLQPTRKEFAGSYTFVTFPYLRASKKSPEETG